MGRYRGPSGYLPKGFRWHLRFECVFQKECNFVYPILTHTLFRPLTNEMLDLFAK